MPHKSSYGGSKKAGGKVKSKKQVGFLLSKKSPLSMRQMEKLKTELHSGKVKVKKGK